MFETDSVDSGAPRRKRPTWVLTQKAKVHAKRAKLRIPGIGMATATLSPNPPKDVLGDSP